MAVVVLQEEVYSNLEKAIREVEPKGSPKDLICQRCSQNVMSKATGVSVKQSA